MEQSFSRRRDPPDPIGVDDLIAVFAHDVSNMASALAGVFELLISGQVHPEGEEYDAFVSMGYHCSRDLLDAIGCIVDLHRIRTGRRTLSECAFKIDELARNALEQVAERARDRRITLVNDVQPVGVAGDAALIRRALSALLRHAIAVTPKGGAVHLYAGLAHASDRPALWIRVSDQSLPLFPDEERHPLTSLFSSERAEGDARRGFTLDDVGLAFCTAMARLHGGEAWVVSRDAAGNEFHCLLPAPLRGEEGDA